MGKKIYHNENVDHYINTIAGAAGTLAIVIFFLPLFLGMSTSGKLFLILVFILMSGILMIGTIGKRDFTRSEKIAKRIKSQGHYRDVRVSKIEKTFNSPYGIINKHSPPTYRIHCSFFESGREYICKSWYLNDDPTNLIIGPVRVYYNPGNPKEYFVDVEAALLK